MPRITPASVVAVVLAHACSAAVVWGQANLNPEGSLCLELREALSSNTMGPCLSDNAECTAGPQPDGILQCSDDDLDALNGGICVDQACYPPGAKVIVDLEIGPTEEPVCGTQVFLSWDVDNLRFQGAVADPDGEFTQDNPGITFVLVYQKDFAAGTIDLAVALPIDIPCDKVNGTMTGGTIARLFFEANGECKSGGVDFRPHNPTSYVSGPSGAMMSVGCNGEASPSGTDQLTIQGPPLWKCPESSSGPAPCGSVARPVTFPPIAVNTCDPNLPPITELCTVLYFPKCMSDADCPGGACPDGICTVPVERPEIDLEHLLPTGGPFLFGRTEIHCSYTDSCGQTGVCDVIIENEGNPPFEDCFIPVLSGRGMAVLMGLLLLGVAAVSRRRSEC